MLHGANGGRGDAFEKASPSPSSYASPSPSFLLQSSPPRFHHTPFPPPAMYGDQENRLAAVSSCEGRVRETIAKRPELAPAFLKLALLDGLTFDGKKGGGGDGSIIAVVKAATPTGPEFKNLQGE